MRSRAEARRQEQGGGTTAAAGPVGRRSAGTGAFRDFGLLALVVLVAVLDEVRAGRGRCLVGRHDWWVCDAGGPDHAHRHCLRCGADSNGNQYDLTSGNKAV